MNFARQRPKSTNIARALGLAFLLVSASATPGWSLPAGTPSLAPAATPTSTGAVDPLLQATVTSDGFWEFLGTMAWLLFAAGALFIARRPLAAVMNAIARTIQQRGVSLDVAGLRVSISETPLEAIIGGPLSLTGSPLEIAVKPMQDTAIHRYAPGIQMQFPITDFFARAKAAAGGSRDVEATKKSREDLGRACARGDASWIRKALEDHTRALERARFIDAVLLLPLIRKSNVMEQVVAGIANRKALEDGDRFILHGVAVAHVQALEWQEAGKLLERLMRDDYWPGAGDYVASRYHVFMSRLFASNLDLDTEDFFNGFDEDIHKEIRKLNETCELLSDEDWTAFGVDDRDFYKRRFYSVCGGLVSIVAELSSSQRDTTQRKTDDLFAEARWYLEKCVDEIPDPYDKARDRNNLADLHKQIGDVWRLRAGGGRLSPAAREQALDKAKSEYARALELMRKALAENSDAKPELRQPVLYKSLAEIRWSMGEHAEALAAVLQYSEAEVERGELFQRRQHIRNQIYAARLFFNHPKLSVEMRSAMAMNVLERVEAFVANNPDAATANDVATVYEMSGYVRLGLPGHELDAVSYLEKVQDDGENGAVSERWLRQLLLARARIRASRRLRHCNPVAAPHRLRPAWETLQGAFQVLQTLDPGATKSSSRRLEYVSLHLDTLDVALELGEELFAQHAIAEAKSWAKKVDGRLRQRLDLLMRTEEIIEVLREKTDDASRLTARLRELSARSSFLTGRMFARDSAGMLRVADVERALAILSRARGVDADLDPWIDIESARLLLDASRSTNDPAFKWSHVGIAFLERALSASDETVRNRALQLQHEAYARYGAAAPPSLEVR